MVRRSWKGLALGVVAIAPFVTSAQGLFELSPPGSQSSKVELGGSPSIDLVVLKGTAPGAPLRNGNVMNASERVELNGKVLRRGVDYTMDYAAGVVYLAQKHRAGDSLIVSYRFDASKPLAQGTPAGNGFAGFRFDLMPGGGLQAVMGLGMTERMADGSVLSSNIYGLNNSFSIGGGKLKGMFMIGDREQVDAEGGMGPKQQQGPVEQGRSKFLVQDYQGSLGGGTISMSMQDISKNFTGFSAIRGAGMENSLVDQLQKEKGLKRFGMGMKDVSVGGGIKFSNSYNNVEDGDGSIDWRSFSLGQGDPEKGRGFNVNWLSRKVDPSFKRFGDLREGDREIMRREAGLLRESLSGMLNAGVGKFSFSQNKIEDLNGNGIYSRNLEVFDGAKPDSSKFFLRMGDQHVESGFGRIGSLDGKEQQEYGRERGLRRQWTLLDVGYWDPKNPIKYAQNSVRTDTGDFSSTKLALGGGGWSIQHMNASVDPGFNALDSLPDKEKIDHINNIGAMYAPGGPALNAGNERGWFNRSAGIERDFTRFSMKPGAGWSMVVENLDIDGISDSATVQTASLIGKNLNLSYRRQEMGDNFTDLNNLLEFERQRLGPLVGLDRTDISASWRIGGKNFTFNNLKVNAPQGGAGRQTIGVTGKDLDISVSNRHVDDGFTNINQLLDPERDLLYSLQGYSERDIRAKWQMVPGLWLDVFWLDAFNSAKEQVRAIHNANISWTGKNTKVDYLKLENRDDNPFSVLLASVFERTSLSHNFGRFGSVKFVRESQDFDGMLTDAPDFDREMVSYETKLNAKTTVRTEQSRTRFDNGDKEDISQNTVSTELSKRLGVSVSEVNVDRGGDDKDEKKRNYGFWFDLGKGLRFSYGYARHLAGETAGTMQSGVSVSQGPVNNLDPGQVQNIQPGQVGGLQVGGGYGVSEWDQNGRTQAFSKVQLSTVKPLTLGRIHDIRFGFGLDTQADYSNWLRENRQMYFAGKLGNNSFQYDYKSQMHQSGSRGIDRTFRFETDQDPKRWLVAKLMYKLRTLPWDDQVMIRDYSIIARPVANMEITHKLQTNPDNQARPDVILGSLPQPIRKAEWRLDYKVGNSFTLGGQYDEAINEQQNQRLRRGGMNLTLFQNSGSPLSLYYGVEQNDLGGVRRTVQRYHIRFDQRPGPNQFLGLFIGNEGYEHFVNPGTRRHNWTARLDYQVKF